MLFVSHLMFCGVNVSLWTIRPPSVHLQRYQGHNTDQPNIDLQITCPDSWRVICSRSNPSLRPPSVAC